MLLPGERWRLRRRRLAHKPGIEQWWGLLLAVLAILEMVLSGGCSGSYGSCVMAGAGSVVAAVISCSVI